MGSKQFLIYLGESVPIRGDTSPNFRMKFEAMRHYAPFCAMESKFNAGSTTETRRTRRNAGEFPVSNPALSIFLLRVLRASVVSPAFPRTPMQHGMQQKAACCRVLASKANS
jgi:hypothetical protein